MNPHIFRAYDIRGIAHLPKSDLLVDLNSEIIELIGKGVGTYLLRHSGPKIAIGGDNRLSTPDLKAAFTKGLLSTGCQVIDIGLSPSPLLYYATCKLGLDGGINITASHNPKEYNGIKIVGKKAHAICGEDLQEIYRIIEEEAFKVGEGSLIKRNDIFDIYIAELKSKIKLGRPVKVIVDAGNGVTGPFIPKLLRSLGCVVEELYCDLDGNFPNHPANPEEVENLAVLIRKMKNNEAEIGLGFDGDGDRIGIIDEKGNHYAADIHLFLLAKDLLGRIPGASIVFDVKVSQVIPELIRKYGGNPIMAKTGHSFIEQTMHEKGALLAGEVSGHLFFGEDYYGFDDALLAAAKTIEIISQGNNPLSAHFKEIPKTYTTPEIKIPCPDDRKFKIVEKLRDYFVSIYDCITIDGVRILFDQNTWGIIRCSNTTPNITMRFEALTKKRLGEIISIIIQEMGKYPVADISHLKSLEKKLL
ncbi:MAG: phosphomannomutase, phosphomannomutase / phosphoglucomutase [Candidatus Peregrinibacteria bacterium GW2011_GWE2_39_6]|nr:MAG: phosphomannomutase, phosphomannomutase / phosphoglucomutase [Candidatus Peregrinibacteria bacterium GW2011_GWF2_39_17]KKR25378.1 MAG: phosphomannomutase, phosphomannomutase / phosphoglucomutase [Candidatus Peregrinibacteria bacterium GW2011_GWE2_39_6]HCW32440.1 phosphomannomutase [Candidatus Peregrinibacteria bacterium]